MLKLISKSAISVCFDGKQYDCIVSKNSPLTFSRMDVRATSQSNSNIVYTQDKATPTVNTKNTPPTFLRSSASAELVPPFS